MTDKTEFEYLRAELLAAAAKIQELLPRALDAAFEQGGRQAAHRLAELAMAFPTSSSATAAKKQVESGARPGRGKVIGRIGADLKACGEAGVDEASYRQSLVDEGIKRSSIHMAIKRLIETGVVVQIDGRLYHDQTAKQLSDEGPADAGERSSDPSSEQHKRENSYAASITSTA